MPKQEKSVEGFLDRRVCGEGDGDVLLYCIVGLPALAYMMTLLQDRTKDWSGQTMTSPPPPPKISRYQLIKGG